MFFKLFLAGATGIEPVHTRVKVSCLTDLATPQFFGTGDYFLGSMLFSQLPVKAFYPNTLFLIVFNE